MLRSLIAGACLFAALPLPNVLQAQRIGDSNDARLLSSVSAAALGQPAGASLGLTRASLSYPGPLAVGDLALGPGALRLVAAHPKNFEGYALGYAAPLAQRALAPFISTTVGAELSLGYLGYRLSRPTTYIGNGTYVDAHLTLPLAVRLGDASRFSFTSYVAPYADLGAAPSGYWVDAQGNGVAPGGCPDVSTCRFLYTDHHRTVATGAAVGLRVTEWRLGLDAAYGDLPASRSQLGSSPMSIGFSVRF